MTLSELIIVGESLDLPDAKYCKWLYDLKLFFQTICDKKSMQDCESAIFHNDNKQMMNKFKNQFLGKLYSLNSNSNEVNNMDKIFIVHGHDDSMKESVARLLEKLNLEPIILAEQAPTSKTLIEKFEKYAADAEFAIILYSPDDNVNETEKRARQNVVFEHGYFCSKLGRDKVLVIKHGDVSLYTDIIGVEYIDFDKDWKNYLANALKQAGFKVDKNKL